MKKIWLNVLILVFGVALGLSAQTGAGGKWIGSAVVISFDPTITQAMCGVPPVGVWSDCQWGAGRSYSTGIVPSGATVPAWVQYLPLPATNGVQKVNNVSPGPNGNVTISCGPVVSVSPIAVTGTITLTQLETPTVTVTNTCTGLGS